jgi:hypothetical protein
VAVGYAFVAVAQGWKVENLAWVLFEQVRDVVGSFGLQSASTGPLFA